MKKISKFTVLIALMLTLVGTMLHAQTRGGVIGTIKKDGVGVEGIKLEVLLYFKAGVHNYDVVKTVYTTTGGNFGVWLTPFAEYPDTVFDRIAVRGTIPHCAHREVNFSTNPVPYKNGEVGTIDYNYSTTQQGVPDCNVCPNLGIPHRRPLK